MRIAIPVTDDDQVAHGWGRAQQLALVDVTDNQISAWRVVPVGWDVLHDEGTEGSHHAPVVRFCREQQITDVVVQHMGQGMVNTLTKLGLHLHQTSLPGARESIEALLGSQA